MKANARLERSDTAKRLGLVFDRTEMMLFSAPFLYPKENEMQLIEYEDISKLLDLNIENKYFDEEYLKAAYKEIENAIGYFLEEDDCFETLEVIDNRVILDAVNLVKVIERINKEKNDGIFLKLFENKTLFENCQKLPCFKMEVQQVECS